MPVRVHARAQADEFKRLGKRYNAQWTPTILVLDAAGEERHRVEGFLPAADFIAQLALGRAKAAFANGDFAEAERRYREVVDRYPKSPDPCSVDGAVLVALEGLREKTVLAPRIDERVVDFKKIAELRGVHPR